jgi:nickel transport system permease protein
MLQLALGRAVQCVPALLLLSLVAFGLTAIGPIDPARMALTGGIAGVNVNDEALAAKRVELGLDRPLPERYVRWLGDVIHLNLGTSYMTKRSVVGEFASRAPASAALGGLALLISIVLGLPLGVMVAVRAGTGSDRLTRVATLIGASFPAFWIALLAMWLFAATLHWLPALGGTTPSGFVLPSLVLALPVAGRILRLMRATTLDALGKDWMVVAKAKGLGDFTIIRRHLLRNALLPVLTVIGLDFAALVSGSAVIEWVFSWPGVGRLSVDAALAGDTPVLMTFILLVGVLVVVANLAIDILYAVVDPRLRLKAGA